MRIVTPIPCAAKSFDQSPLVHRANLHKYPHSTNTNLPGIYTIPVAPDWRERIQSDSKWFLALSNCGRIRHRAAKIGNGRLRSVAGPPFAYENVVRFVLHASMHAESPTV